MALKMIPCPADNIGFGMCFDMMDLFDEIRGWSDGHFAQLKQHITTLFQHLDTVVMCPNQETLDRVEVWLNRNISPEDLQFADVTASSGKLPVRKILNCGFSDLAFQALLIVMVTFLTVQVV